MALTVPRQQEPQVGIQPVSTPRMSGLSPEAFGSAVAKGLESMGDEVFKQAKEAREQEELTAFNQAKLDLMKFDSDLLNGEGGLLNRVGAEAKGLETQANEAWKKKRQENFDRLKAFPAAQQLYNAWAEERWISTATTLNKHEADERQKTAVATQSAVMEQQFELSLREPTPGNIAALEGSVASLGQLKGMDAEQLKNAKAEVRSKLFAAGIQRAFDAGDVTGGIALFEQRKDELTREERHALEPIVTKVKIADEGEMAATEVWNTLGPKGMNDPIKIVEMEKALKKIENPSVREEAQRELGHMATRWNQQQSELHQGNVQSVYGMILERRPYKAIVSSKEFNALPPQSQLSLKNTIEAEYKPKVDAEQQVEIRLAQAEMFADIVERIEKGEVRVTDPREAFRYVDVLGIGKAKELSTLIRSHNAKLGKVSLGDRYSTSFNNALRELRAQGIEFVPDPDNRKGKVAKADYGNLYSAVQTAIIEEQERVGRVLTQEDLDRKIRELVRPATVNARWTLGGVELFGTTDRKPAYKIENPRSMNVRKTLEERLGRKPTDQEVKAAERALGQ